MIKALSAIAIAAFAAAALTVLPGFAPEVAASVPQALAKADRLDIRPVGRDCSQQAWPNFEASCLRVAGTKATNINVARLATADRTPAGFAAPQRPASNLRDGNLMKSVGKQQSLMACDPRSPAGQR